LITENRTRKISVEHFLHSLVTGFSSAGAASGTEPAFGEGFY
jgi:hypothetical protein